MDLSSAVARCRSSAALLDDLARIYDRADRAAGVCMGGGMCCKFDLFDHRLYATVPELALLTIDPPPDLSRAKLNRCPYQVGPDCAAHPRRPLGCRVFSCNPDQALEDRALGEALHAQIRLLHQTYCCPYVYAELPSMVLQLYSCK